MSPTLITILVFLLLATFGGLLVLFYFGRRKQRVRLHLRETGVGENLPSIEGYLTRKLGREYVIALPRLLVEVGRDPADLESRLVRVPRENVLFYEVLR